MKLDILGISVHPDDIELSCSGTIFKHIAQGKKVGIVDLTRGELGTRGSAAIRTEEAKKAAEVMGLSVRENLDMADGFFQHTQENLIKIARVIRQYQPDIVLANALSDRHPDHGRASKLTADACFISGLVKVEISDDDGQLLERWRPKAVYHYIQDHNLHPDFVVDVTGYMDQKIESIMAYKSQFFDPNSKELATPISSAGFIEFVKAKSRVYGRTIGAEYGEGFNVARPIGVNNLFDLL